MTPNEEVKVEEDQSALLQTLKEENNKLNESLRSIVNRYNKLLTLYNNLFSTYLNENSKEN